MSQLPIFDALEGADHAEAYGPAGHWMFTADRLQMLTTNLDRGLMTLAAARTYLQAYGACVAGATKAAFLRNLAAAVRSSTAPQLVQIPAPGGAGTTPAALLRVNPGSGSWLRRAGPVFILRERTGYEHGVATEWVQQHHAEAAALLPR